MHILKIAFSGEEKVGKGSLVERYCHDTFNPDKIRIGIDFEIEYVSFFMHGILQRCKLQMVIYLLLDLQWTTPQQGCRFRVIQTGYLRNCNAVGVVFDITNADSFEALPKWQVF